MLRVNYDALEEDPEWIWDFFYNFNGKPFTGVAYETWPDGKLMSEAEYVDGRAEGFIREWYPSGNIKSEGYRRVDGRYGWEQEWFENGMPKSEIVVEWSKCVQKKVWNEAGELTSNYEQSNQTNHDQ